MKDTKKKIKIKILKLKQISLKIIRNKQVKKNKK